ncbi:hypothetical protein BJ878DRAFT_522774 [Calycina marina]|uniref:Uncharacterized protein n=1 Tax=Calycina marina TaxID=1763456 RepID=A0A9P8CD83_9HELO|nr:hypothetical protein BJ878DRAFT_522774 [Calycina marina]
MPRRKLSAAENSALPLQTAAVRRSRRTVIGNQPLNHSPLQSLPAPTRAKKNRSDLQAATSSNPTDDIATTTEEEEASASAPSRSPSADTGNQYSNITSRISESPTPSLQQKVFPQQEVPAKAASNKMARSSALVRAAEAEDESLLDAPITENLATPNKHARGEVFISGQPSAKRARHLADTTSRSTNTPMAEARTPAQLRHNDNTKKPVKKKIGGGYLTPGPMPRRTPYVIDPRTMTPHERRVDLYQRTGLRNRVEYQGPPEDDEPEIITHSDGTTRELSPLNQVNQYMLNHTIPSLPDIPASRYTGHSKTDKIFRKVYQIPEPGETEFRPRNRSPTFRSAAIPPNKTKNPKDTPHKMQSDEKPSSGVFECTPIHSDAAEAFSSTEKSPKEAAACPLAIQAHSSQGDEKKPSSYVAQAVEATETIEAMKTREETDEPGETTSILIEEPTRPTPSTRTLQVTPGLSKRSVAGTPNSTAPIRHRQADNSRRVHFSAPLVTGRASPTHRRPLGEQENGDAYAQETPNSFAMHLMHDSLAPRPAMFDTAVHTDSKSDVHSKQIKKVYDNLRKNQYSHELSSALSELFINSPDFRNLGTSAIYCDASEIVAYLLTHPYLLAMAGALVKYNEEHPNTPVPNYFETYEALERFDARFDYTDPPTPDDINRKMQYHEEQEALKHQSAATLAEQVSRQQEPQNLVTNQGQSFFQNPFSAPLSAVKSLFAAGTDTTPTPTPSSTHSNSSSAKKLSPMPTKPGAFPGQRKASPRLSSVKSSKLKPSQQRQVAVKQMRSQNSAQRYLDFTIKAEEQRGYRRREALRTGERDQVTIEKDLELSKDYNSRTGRKRKAGAAGVAGSGYRVPDLDIESEGEGMEAESSQPEEQPATRFPRPGDPDFNYAGHFQVPDYSSSSNSDDEEEAVPEHSDQHNITVPPNFPVEADSLVHPTDINDAPSNVFSPGPSVPDMDIPLSPKPTPTKRDKDIDRPKHVRIDDAPAPRAAVAVEETIAEIPSTPAAPSAALQEKAWPQSAPPKTPRPANATLPQPSPTKTLKHQPIRPSTLREVQTASPLASPFASVDEVEHHDAMVVRDFVNGMMEGDIMRTMLPAFMRAPADGVENHDAMVIFDFVNGMMGGDVTGTTFPAFMTEAMASQGNKIEQAVALVV